MERVASNDEAEDYHPDTFVDFAPTEMAAETMDEDKLTQHAANYARDTATRHYPAPKRALHRADEHTKLVAFACIAAGVGVIGGLMLYHTFLAK